MEFLHGQVTEPGRDVAHHVLGIADAGRGGTQFPGEPEADLDGRQQSGCLGWSDARGPLQLGRGPRGQASERTARRLQQTPGDRAHVLSCPAGSQEDRDQFRGRQGGGPQRPETFAGEIGGRSDGWTGG